MAEQSRDLRTNGLFGSVYIDICFKKVLESLLQFNLLKSPLCTIDKIINGVNIEEYHMPKRNGLSTRARASRTVDLFKAR